jgi:hypothetical protein
LAPSPIRVIVALAGLGLLGAGVVAVFVTDNGTGSAALVSVGAALLVVAGVWDRLQSVELPGAKVQLQVVEHLRDRADEADARGDTAVAEALRTEARGLLDDARPLASSYEQLRESLAPGAERTAKLEEVVAKAKAAAAQAEWQPAQVQQLFESSTDGNRIYALALMEADERLRDFGTALDVIEHSRSAFEQWHALHVAQLMLPTLTNDERRTLRTLLSEQPGQARHIKPGTDRWRIAQQLLTELGTLEPA